MRRRAWPKLVGLHDRLFLKDRNNHGNTRAAIAAASRKSPHLSSRKIIDSKTSDSPSRPPPPPTPPRGKTTRTSSTNGDKGQQLPANIAATSLTPDHNNNTDATSATPDHNNNREADEEEHSITSASSILSSRDKILAVCDDFDQIERDVARCTWHLLTGTQRSVSLQMEHKRHRKVRKLIRRKQRRLANLINLTLQQSYPFLNGPRKLNYYQGYHDVACIVLSTLGGSRPVSVGSISSSNNKLNSNEYMAASMGLDLPSAVLLQLSQSHFLDYMKANFSQLQTALRLTLFPLLGLLDEQVHNHLSECEMEPFFALSWIITWFSHDIRDTVLVKRLFDLFLVSHPLMPIYVSIAMILHPVNRQLVLETECDFSLVHQTLQGLPRNSSMVGWKYRPGDGYVSDDEEGVSDDEDDELMDCSSQTTLDADLSSLMSSNFKKKHVSEEQPQPEAISIESSYLSSSWTNARVPFQDLIDMAVKYMRKVPPHKLQTLAERYYGPEQVDCLLSDTPDISLLETPPDWATAMTAKADWVLQQRQKRLKRRNSKQIFDDGGEDDDASMVEGFLKDNANNPAVIAAGFGTGDDPERRRRKRRRMMMVTAIAVAVFAVFVQKHVMQLRPQAVFGESFTTKLQPREMSSSPPPSAASISRPAFPTDSQVTSPEIDEEVEVNADSSTRAPSDLDDSTDKVKGDSFLGSQSDLDESMKLSEDTVSHPSRPPVETIPLVHPRQQPDDSQRGRHMNSLGDSATAMRQDVIHEASHLQQSVAISSPSIERRESTKQVLLLSDQPHWLNALVSVQKASVRHAVSIGKRIGSFRKHFVTPHLRSFSSASVRLMDDIRQKMFVKLAEAITQQQTQLAFYVQNNPALKEVNTAIRAHVGQGAVVLREKLYVIRYKFQPHLDRLSRLGKKLVDEIRSRDEFAHLLKLSKELLKQLERNSIRNEREAIPKHLENIGQAGYQPRIRTLSRASKHIKDTVGKSKLISELEDVIQDVKVLAASEKLVYALEKIGDFTVVQVILDVLRGVATTRLSMKLTALVEELEHRTGSQDLIDYAFL